MHRINSIPAVCCQNKNSAGGRPGGAKAWGGYGSAMIFARSV
jgi:hypothetical protein